MLGRCGRVGYGSLAEVLGEDPRPAGSMMIHSKVGTAQKGPLEGEGRRSAC